MKFISNVWTIKKLITNKDKVNLTPKFQRSSVWTPSKKKLLIDSILRGYDLPKFYFVKNPNNSMHLYEVADGQQRIRSIWEFADELSGFSVDASLITGINATGIKINELKTIYKIKYNKFLNFKLDIALISDGSPEEVRALFARLQMGERLNSAELRNAIASNLGAA